MEKNIKLGEGGEGKKKKKRKRKGEEKSTVFFVNKS